MCVLDFCVVAVVWSVLSLWLFYMFLDFWIVYDFIFKCCNFFNSHFPVTSLGLDLFCGTYLDKLLLLWQQIIENIST